MGSTYLSLHYHFVFSTKDRQPIIEAQIQPRLYEYLAGALRSMGCGAECVGGTTDHVHLLIWLKATQNLSDTLRDLKRSSVRWMQNDMGHRRFGWQEGYGAFTVSASALPAVKRYISHQAEHHRVRTFREEFEDMLKLAGVAYDPAYLD